jgi:hypothetical protein
VGENFGRKIFPKLLEENSGFYVGKIVRVSNKTLHRAKIFFTIEILDNSNNIVARISLGDSGLFVCAGFASERFKINPFKSIHEVSNFFKSKSILKYAGSEIESIEYECVYARGCAPSHPFLKIKTPTKTFYMNSKNIIYEVKNIEKLYSSDFRYSTDIINKYSLIIKDKINDEILFLNKLK